MAVATVNVAVAVAARAKSAMDKTRRVAQACDACKLRKVKCNGLERCQQCSHLDLKCIYSAVRAQRRTSQKRGRLISEYKKSTAAASGSFPASIKPALDAASVRQSSPPSDALAATTVTSPTSPTLPNGQRHGNLSITSIDGIISNRHNKNGNSDDVNNAVANSPCSSPLFNQDFFLDLLPAYSSVVYPLNPIISETELRESIAHISHDREHAALAYAAAAVTINLTRSGSVKGAADGSSDISDQIRQLITKSIELAGGLHLDTRLTIRRVMIPMFLHNCLMTLQKLELAFFYMREALSMMQMLRIGSAEMLAKSQFDLPERARRERLYWLAFVHERFLSIVDYRPAILTPLPELPEHDPNIPDGVHEGFNQIIKLFRLVDGDFLHNWLGSHSDSGLTSAWIEQKQKELDDEDDYFLLGNNGSAGAGAETGDINDVGTDATTGTASGVVRALQAPGVTRLTDMQQADLIITRQWLRTVVWQMAMSRCLLSSGASKECMSLLFPVRLSHQLRFLITRMSRDAIEIHGSGILKKLFELADTIADVIIHVPIASLDETTARVDDFLFLIRFLFTFPRFDPFEKEILREKLKRLQALFPYIQDQDHGQDQGSDHGRRHDQNQSQNHNRSSSRTDASGSMAHHQHSPGSVDGTASTITVIGTDPAANAQAKSMMNVPPQVSLPSPLLSLATTAQRSHQHQQQKQSPQHQYQHQQQHHSPASTAANPVSAETSPNLCSNPNPKPYSNPWLGMTRTVLYHRADPSFAVNLAPSPPPSSNSAASIALSSPTLSAGGVPPAHGQTQNEIGSTPAPASLPASAPAPAPYNVVNMARAQSQTQAHMQSHPTNNASERGKGSGIQAGVSGAESSAGQGALNAKWQSMTRRLSMASGLSAS